MYARHRSTERGGARPPGWSWSGCSSGPSGCVPPRRARRVGVGRGRGRGPGGSRPAGRVGPAVPRPEPVQRVAGRGPRRRPAQARQCARPVPGGERRAGRLPGGGSPDVPHPDPARERGPEPVRPGRGGGWRLVGPGARGAGARCGPSTRRCSAARRGTRPARSSPPPPTGTNSRPGRYHEGTGPPDPAGAPEARCCPPTCSASAPGARPPAPPPTPARFPSTVPPAASPTSSTRRSPPPRGCSTPPAGCCSSAGRTTRRRGNSPSPAGSSTRARRRRRRFAARCARRSGWRWRASRSSRRSRTCTTTARCRTRWSIWCSPRRPPTRRQPAPWTGLRVSVWQHPAAIDVNDLAFPSLTESVKLLLGRSPG